MGMGLMQIPRYSQPVPHTTRPMMAGGDFGGGYSDEETKEEMEEDGRDHRTRSVNVHNSLSLSLSLSLATVLPACLFESGRHACASPVTSLSS